MVKKTEACVGPTDHINTGPKADVSYAVNILPNGKLEV